MVFWSDVREERIYRAPIDSGYPDQALLTQAVVTADGLAVDWVYSHLYWTDAGADTISGLEWDGKYKCEVQAEKQSVGSFEICCGKQGD